MSISDFVVPQFGWAKREVKKDGTTEEIVGIHFKRPKDKLVDMLKEQKFENIYKKVRNRDKEKDIRKKVDDRYNHGKYTPEISEFSRSTLHEKSRDELKGKRTYYSEDRRAGIGFIHNTCDGSMKYDSVIPEFPNTGLEDIFKEIDGTYREAYTDDEDEENQPSIPQKELSKEDIKNLRKKLNRIYREINKQDKKYTFNFALRTLVEADSWDSANKTVDELTSFVGEKMNMNLVAQRCIDEDEDKIKVLYLFHITEPKSYDLETNSIMNELLDEIVERELMRNPGKGRNDMKKKWSNIYQKKYCNKSIPTMSTLFNAGARNKLMRDIKMGALNWIYTGMAKRIIEKTKVENFSYNEIGGSPYSSMIFSGLKTKGIIKILPYHSSLKDEMPNWEWLELGKEHKSELEKDFEERGTHEWLDYMERQGYLGTQVIGIKYKDLKDRNEILKNYSLLPSLFVTSLSKK